MPHISPSYSGGYSDSSARSGTLFMAVLRVVFVLALGAVGWSLASDPRIGSGLLVGLNQYLFIGFAVMAVIIIAGVVVLIPQK